MSSTNYKIVQADQNTWWIEDGGVRFFLLTGTEKALLIDSGMNVHNAKEIAESLTDLPVFLLNTHADMDHIGSTDEFDSFYMHPDEAPCFSKGGQIIPVRDGDEIELGGRKLRIIHLPGHTPGSVAVLDVNKRVLISGDPVQVHGHIFMFGENRNMEQYIRSLEKLEAMAADFDEYWPSHADIPVKKDVTLQLLNGAKSILNKEITGKEVELFGRKAAAYDLGFTVLLCEE